MIGYPKLEEWFDELLHLAKERGVESAVCLDMESYRDYFEDGDSPSEALEDELDHKEEWYA